MTYIMHNILSVSGDGNMPEISSAGRDSLGCRKSAKPIVNTTRQHQTGEERAIINSGKAAVAMQVQ